MHTQTPNPRNTGADAQSRPARAMARCVSRLTATHGMIATREETANRVRTAMIDAGHKMLPVAAGERAGREYHATICLCCRTRVEVRGHAGVYAPVYIDTRTGLETKTAPPACIPIETRPHLSNDEQIRVSERREDF